MIDGHEEYTLALATEFSLEKMRTIATQACRGRAPLNVATIAHDPTRDPELRILELSFASPEDRDKVIIAMRMIERENALSSQRAANAQNRAKAVPHLMQPAPRSVSVATAAL